MSQPNWSFFMIKTAESFTLTINELDYIFDPTVVNDGYAEWRCTSINGVAVARGALQGMVSCVWTPANRNRKNAKYVLTIDLPITDFIDGLYRVKARERSVHTFYPSQNGGSMLGSDVDATDINVGILKTALASTTFGISDVVVTRGSFR